MNDDIKTALSFAARTAIEQSVPIDELEKTLRESFSEADLERKRQDARDSQPHAGMFVTYLDEKKGNLTAHVREVREGNRLDLRAHRTAQPDFNVDDVPFSEKPQKGHWSYR